MTTPAPLEDMARLVLAAYDLPASTLHFIAHSDTFTFKVKFQSPYLVQTPATIHTGDLVSACLLRLHQPVTAGMGAHGADPNSVRSELQWLEALNQETDLALQSPIRNREGRLVTQVGFPERSTPLNASLLTWLEGEPYRRQDESPDTAFQLGKILAILHNHAQAWQLPPGFTRPSRDSPYFETVLQALRPAADDGRITAVDFNELAQSVSLLLGRLAGLDRSPRNYGVIHADTHKGNLLFHQGQLRLIDFSFTAIGPYLFDLGIAMSDMQPELHLSFLAGYASLRMLPADYSDWIESLFVGSMVGTLSYWVENPQAQEILLRKAPQTAQQFARPLNMGEHFWFKPEDELDRNP